MKGTVVMGKVSLLSGNAVKGFILATLFVGLSCSSALADNIIIKVKSARMSCDGGRYEGRLELHNGNTYVQHPSIYVKLIKVGIYGEECVELVEYIPEMPPESTDIYLVPFKTPCKVLVKPSAKLMPKRWTKTAKGKNMVAAWTEGCPPRRVVEPN
jgi:hypothetical protein